MMEINIANIVEIFFFAGAIIGVYVRNQVKVKELEMKIKSLEHDVNRVDQEDNKIYEKLDLITSMLTEIKIELGRKQDRN